VADLSALVDMKLNSDGCHLAEITRSVWEATTTELRFMDKSPCKSVSINRWSYLKVPKEVHPLESLNDSDDALNGDRILPGRKEIVRIWGESYGLDIRRMRFEYLDLSVPPN